MRSLKFKHIGVAVSDIAQAVDAYRAIFGYRVLSGPFDDPIQNVSVCFLGAGPSDDLVMELVAPLNEQSPVSKLLVNGLGAYHVCYEVDDLASALSHVRRHGCLVISQPAPAIAFDGRRIAWVYTPTRQLVELLEQEIRHDSASTL